jgi:uncharacterized protein (DUF924 family)
LEPDPNDLLRFWFGEPPGKQRREWFVKDAGFDGELRRRFGELHAMAARRGLEGWRDSPEPMLALVIVLDQLSRNLHRGDARAFAQDAHARECAAQAISRGDDLELLPVQRQFLYLPYEHSESIADQDRGVELMRSLDGFAETKGMSDYALRHREVIRRFGRFPHRNEVMGRASTPEEAEFLRQPGSRF